MKGTTKVSDKHQTDSDRALTKSEFSCISA